MLNIQPFQTNVTARETKGKYPNTVVGKGTVICPSARICAGTVIGRNCLICSNVVIREGCTIGDNVLIANGVTINYNVWIGSRTKIMDNTHITGGMIVGGDVFISCLVATSNDNSMGRHKGTRCNPPSICNRAVIGAGANILPGVIIQCDAIVAAGAVVTKDVLSNTTVMGVPARVRK